VIQVLTVAVQNVVRSADLGAATSGVANLSGSGGTGPVQAYADALHNVFVGVLPMAVLAFVLSWFLDESPVALHESRVRFGFGWLQ
jgi:hypothetical protein